MIDIESDDKECQTVLEDMVSLIQSNKGILKPGLKIKNENNSLSLHDQMGASQGSEDAHPCLIQLPESLLVPVQEFDLSLSGSNDIVSSKSSSHVSSVQKELMDMMLLLFNKAKKIDLHENTTPWVLYNDFEDIIELFLEARPQYKTDVTGLEDLKEGNVDDFLIKNFFKSRMLAFQGDKTKDPVKVIMPLIDCANHHFRGSSFLNKTDQNNVPCLRVNSNMPLPGSDECFLNYGPYDCLDLYLNYSYIDNKVPFVRSIPLKINLPDLGVLEIGAHNGLVKHTKIPENLKDVQFYIPNIRIDFEREITKVGFLIIPQGQAPQALRRSLQFILASMGPHLKPYQIQNHMRELEKYILQENIEFYASLKILAQERLESYKASSANGSEDKTGRKTTLCNVLQSAIDMATAQIISLKAYPFFRDK